MKKEEASRKKNYYIGRMAASNTQIRMEEDEEKSLTLLKEKKIKKLPKQVAKEARERKKAYISMLEEQIEGLRVENRELVKNITILSEENNRLRKNYCAEDYHFQGLIEEFQHLYKVLDRQNQGQISRSLSILRDKYGISGRQRSKAINNQFDKILQLCMPMHFRLLMENCQDTHKFYRLLSVNNRIKQFVRLGDREKDIIVKMRPQIIKHKERFDGIINDLYQLKQRLFFLSRQCQGTVDKIEDKLTPQFVGRLLVDLDFYRCEENLDIIYPINHWENIQAKKPFSRKNQMKIIEEDQPVKLIDQAAYLSDLQILDQLFG